MYAYIKDGQLVYTSDTLHQKRQEETENKPFIDGLVYDEVIETPIDGRICYENGKIVSWDLSQEKKDDDARINAEKKAQQDEYLKNRPSQIINEIGELKKKKDGLVLLGEPTTEIDAQITALKDEYKTIIV